MPLQHVETIPQLPPRPINAHKGLFGTVLVLGGGRGMAGAPALAGASALRAGAGLVRVICPAEVQPTVASYEPSYLTYPAANDDEGVIRLEPGKQVLKRFLPKADVLALGPGLGQSDELRALVRWVIEEVELPTVVDADALNALVGQTDILRLIRRPVVLTPHPGEFVRLTGKEMGEVQADRVGHAAALAETAKPLVVVLKGAGTVVTDGSRVYVNTTGNPGMATGGTGDVLTGVIAALLGQKLAPFEASQLGVYIHGLAGDIARDQSGEVGLIAGDLVDSLPDVFVHLGG